jgi:hypothetical protein
LIRIINEIADTVVVQQDLKVTLVNRDPEGLKVTKGDKGDTGATGSQGPKGDRGETGEQGAQGEQGESETVRDLSIRTVRGNIAQDNTCNEGCTGPQKSVASCNDDEVLTGGGFDKRGGTISYSKPVDNSWEAYGSATSSQSPSTTQAYAQCATLVPATQQDILQRG